MMNCKSLSIFSSILSRWCRGLLLFGVLTAIVNVQAAEESTNTATDSELSRLEITKTKRNELAEQLALIEQNLRTALADNDPASADILKQQKAALQQLDTIFVQQSAALQSAQTLAAEQAQYREALKNLKASDFTEPVAFVDLDKVHEELDGLAARQSALKAKLKQALTVLTQAQSDFKESRTVLQNRNAELSRNGC